MLQQFPRCPEQTADPTDLWEKCASCLHALYFTTFGTAFPCASTAILPTSHALEPRSWPCLGGAKDGKARNTLGNAARAQFVDNCSTICRQFVHVHWQCQHSGATRRKSTSITIHAANMDCIILQDGLNHLGLRRPRNLCINTPAAKFGWMGYSLRTITWRYTAWFRWN